MTQQDKELLLNDLCARLPYGVRVRVVDDYHEERVCTIHQLNYYNYDLCCIYENGGCSGWDDYGIEEVKPYLRPIRSMTEEEERMFSLHWGQLSAMSRWNDIAMEMSHFTDWLNAHHFDYRGLIGKGLAIEVTKDNNPYKTT